MKKLYKLKAFYNLNLDKRRVVYVWVKELKMPDDYAYKLDRCVDVSYDKMSSMKSHDYHIFLERFLLITFCGFLDPIWRVFVSFMPITFFIVTFIPQSILFIKFFMLSRLLKLGLSYLLTARSIVIT